MTALGAAKDAARKLLGAQGMESLDLRLQAMVRSEIGEAAHKAGDEAARTWWATPCNVKDIAVRDILGEVAF